MKKIDCEQLVLKLRNNELQNEVVNALNQAKLTNNLWEKCVLLRFYTSPQSNVAEKIIKQDLLINDPPDNLSGDGIKNGLKYEIKVSLHDTNCKVNIRQIRPHHNIQYYIIIALNLFEGTKGKAYAFKIPAKTIYELVVEYGGYTHGTVLQNGKITTESVNEDSNRKEYSLTADPNASNGSKSKDLWEIFKNYEVEYNSDFF